MFSLDVHKMYCCHKTKQEKKKTAMKNLFVGDWGPPGPIGFSFTLMCFLRKSWFSDGGVDWMSDPEGTH